MVETLEPPAPLLDLDNDMVTSLQKRSARGYIFQDCAGGKTINNAIEMNHLMH